jgi:hypothetical protein
VELLCLVVLAHQASVYVVLEHDSCTGNMKITAKSMEGFPHSLVPSVMCSSENFGQQFRIVIFRHDPRR